MSIKPRYHVEWSLNEERGWERGNTEMWREKIYTPWYFADRVARVAQFDTHHNSG